MRFEFRRPVVQLVACLSTDWKISARAFTFYLKFPMVFKHNQLFLYFHFVYIIRMSVFGFGVLHNYLMWSYYNMYLIKRFEFMLIKLIKMFTNYSILNF